MNVNYRYVGDELSFSYRSLRLDTIVCTLAAEDTVVLCESVSFDVEQLLDISERREVNLITIVGDAMALPIADALERHPGRWKLQKLYAIGSGGALFSDHLQKRINAAAGLLDELDGLDRRRSNGAWSAARRRRLYPNAAASQLGRSRHGSDAPCNCG